MLRRVRVVSNMGRGAYDHYFSQSPTPEPDPVWPDKSLNDLCMLAFERTGRFIATVDHPVVKQLARAVKGVLDLLPYANIVVADTEFHFGGPRWQST